MHIERTVSDILFVNKLSMAITTTLHHYDNETYISLLKYSILV